VSATTAATTRPHTGIVCEPRVDGRAVLVSVGVRGGGRHRGIIHAVSLRIGGRGACGPTATPGGPHVVYLSLLTDSSIDALPKQVGVPTVARVLLDPVHPELPNRESLFAQTLTKVHVLGQRVVRPRLLANPKLRLPG